MLAALTAAIAWWEKLTAQRRRRHGGEAASICRRAAHKGLIQPALKVRGPEYLRIIYGPEYDLPDNLVRLRERGLRGKRMAALREFALGHEALTRFVARAPLRKTHECVFAVLALESEPIDPRLKNRCSADALVTVEETDAPLDIEAIRTLFRSGLHFAMVHSGANGASRTKGRQRLQAAA